MKILSLISIPFFILLFNKNITITIVDENHETLVGVLDKNSNQYSNLEGEINIKKGNTLYLDFISYNKIIIDNIKNDTIIKMKPL